MRVLILLWVIFAFVLNSVYASPYKGNAKTARIPAGTKLSVQLLQTVDTSACQEGDSFNLMLLNDQKTGGNTVLPSGSVIRGCIREIKPAKRFSRGAVLYLDFDHVVTPAGRQLPVSLSVFGLKTMTYDGGIYKTKGYGQALHDNWTKTCDITKLSTNYGKKAKNVIYGLQFITVPICAFGGAFGGFCYLVGDSAADLFRKGDEVTLLKNSVLEVIMTQPVDVPIS